MKRWRTIMTYQGGPDDPRRTHDYIEQDGSVSWAAIVLGIMFVGLLGFFVFGPSWIVPADRVTERYELPNTAPGTPPVPTPSAPQPQ
jgi:hypothetical protein